MKTTPFITQLKAAVPALAGRVAGTASLEGAAEADLPVPHAFVVALGQQAEADEFIGETTVQSITEQFGVIVAVDNTGDERGQTADDAMDDLGHAIVATVCGFNADNRYSRVEYAGGSQIHLTRARLWWQFDFAATTATDMIS